MKKEILMSEKKGKTTIMILLTALGALAIIILFGWVAFFNPVEQSDEKPQLTLSSFSQDEKSLLPEKSAEELLLDGLQKGEETPLIIDDSNDDIVITIIDEPSKDIKAEDKLPVVPKEPEPVKTIKYKEVTENVYWLQVGSFPNSVKADELRNYLKERGIETIIQTKNINNTLYYRVRVGAFVNEKEADSFKEKLLNLDNIEEVVSFMGTLTKKVPID
jgi:hypothetical protein